MINVRINRNLSEQKANLSEPITYLSEQIGYILFNHLALQRSRAIYKFASDL